MRDIFELRPADGLLQALGDILPFAQCVEWGALAIVGEIGVELMRPVKVSIQPSPGVGNLLHAVIRGDLIVVAFNQPGVIAETKKRLPFSSLLCAAGSQRAPVERKVAVADLEEYCRSGSSCSTPYRKDQSRLSGVLHSLNKWRCRWQCGRFRRERGRDAAGCQFVAGFELRSRWWPFGPDIDSGFVAEDSVRNGRGLELSVVMDRKPDRVGSDDNADRCAIG